MNDFAKKVSGFAIELLEADGHNIPQMRIALKQHQTLPKLLILNTIKGNGVSFMANIMDWHYLPLSQSQYQRAMEEVSQS